MSADRVGAATIGAGKTAILYARAPQYNEHDRTTVETQLAACRALAESLGYAVTAETTLSDDSPASTMARPGLTTLLGILARDGASALVTYSLNRLGRPESEVLEALLRELRRRDVPLYLARIPKGYGYDPATGKLGYDAAEVAAANREPARPVEYIVIPREHERDL